MHCELVVPALFAASAEARLPALELLFARGRRTQRPSRTLERWYEEAFGLEDGTLPAGALTLLAENIEPGASRWARADPVHLRLMRDRLILAPSAAFEIGAEEARALCEAIDTHFAGRLALHPVHPQRWCARLADEQPLDAANPLEAAGRDVDLAHDGGARRDALLNELQMVLHAHPVNVGREARGEPAVNSLWLWGAGRAPSRLQAPWRSIAADDPVAIGLARSAAAQARDLPASADGWLARLPQDGRHLAVLDGLRAPFALSHEAEYRGRVEELERRWFAPLLAALRAGRIGMVTVHVPDAATGVSVETFRGDLRRFWRRARPIERYA